MRFFFDVVCPFAYLASLQVDAIGVDVEWCPILLGGVFREIGAPDRPTTGRAPARVAIEARDLLRQAERLGVKIEVHPKHPVRTVDAMRLCVAAEDPRPVAKALFHAYHAEGRDISDRDVLAGIAREHGVDPSAVDDPAIKERLRARTAEAVARGAFGVPTFLIGDDLYWGADRLPLVRAALFGGAEPRREPRGSLTFFHDFSSPFSYLASTRIERVAERVEWVPILVGALFREIGTPDVPLLAASPQRSRYMAKDLADHARWTGVPFQFSSHFPLRTVTALRVALVEPAVTPAIYRAAWVDDRNIGDAAVLRGVLDEAGFDGAALIERTADPTVKALLFANTGRARLAGACGVPTFVVPSEGGDLLFWGQDRLDMVADALAGWRPAVGW